MTYLFAPVSRTKYRSSLEAPAHGGDDIIVIIMNGGVRTDAVAAIS